jgi:NADH dehydrogenase FAD-containing subunit
MPVFSRIAVFAQFFSVILSPAIAASVSQEYEYVIVGGGITGLVVANRLSEDKNSTFTRLANEPMLIPVPCRVHSRDREW